MESRASIPPGLPRPNPTTSYWQSDVGLSDIADYRSANELPQRADIVIIGSGVSGASIAHNLLESNPSLDVLVLEARQAASGASGRNGGHTKGGTYRTFINNVKLLGEEEAVKVTELEYNCMVAVHEFARKHSIDCDSKRLDTVDVFYSEEMWKGAHEAVTLMQKIMGKDAPAAEYTFNNPEATAAKYLAPDALGSLTYPAGSLSAYKFVIGVLKLTLTKGLKLHCNTPATEIRKEGVDWLVSTPRGVVRAHTLVLATNGYTAHLYPKLQGTIVPLRGFITAQRPGRGMPQNGLETSYSFIYDDGYEYMISRPKNSKHEGDIVIGGGLTKTVDEGVSEFGNTDDTTLNEEVVEYLTGSTRTFFGKNWGEDHADGQVRRAWSGIMGISGDEYPFVGPVPGEDGLFIDASFQGHGMVLCFLCAQAASKLILGQDDEELASWFPNAFRISEKRMKTKFGGLHRLLKAAEATQNGAH